ncbi:MAG: carboxypeptidase regulatory-like domain-containing protein [Prolixibacteraceae bacterium]|nr:carboxypeptidase regulatory-like domain-containing protein [Prolixibacteraceae bacterium]
MKILLSILIITFVSTFIQAQNNSIDKLADALEKSAIDFPKSKVFIKTDKDIYASGEKIWFKAEVFNCLTEGPSSEADLILMIKTELGEVIVDGKYLIMNGLVRNQITIPSWAPEGNAYLIAYTPKALKVNEASLSAIKPITINKLKNNDYILNSSLNKKQYKPGENVVLNLSLNAITPASKKEKLIISLFDYQKEIVTEKVNVVVNERNEFSYELPSTIDDGLYFEIQSTGKNKLTEKKPIYTTHDRITVEFYPEGGTLLTNNIQRIVYRATDPFGKPADITGIVYDEFKNEVGVGKILKKGFGLISLMPMLGQSYTFKIDSKYGNGQKFSMPQTVLNGSAFMLVKTEMESIKVAVNNTSTIIGEQLTVAVVSSGEIKMAFEFEAKKRNNLQVSIADLPIGVINFVLLDSKGKILSERMIYNTPYEDIDVDIRTELEYSESNNELEILVDVKKFIKQFGPCDVDIRVIDEQNLYHNQTGQTYNFLKYPLLTPIPKTVLDIYITNIELIANKYRYFILQELLDGVSYLVKKGTGKNFSGTIADRNGNRIPNATVMAVHTDNPTIATTTSDANGRFMFSSLAKSDNMVVKAISESGKKIYSVHIDRSFDETLEELMLIESFKMNSKYSLSFTPKYVSCNGRLLKLAGSETKNRKPRQMSNSQKMLQSGSSVLDVVRMIKPFTLKGNQIVFYGTTNSINNQQGALIVLDGQKMGTSIDALKNVNPHEVVSINVSTNPVDIQEYTALNSIGIIDIRTKGYSHYRKDKVEVPKKRISEFDQSSIPENVWKYQSTIYWKPNAELNEHGEIKMNLKLSELKSNFVVQVDVTSASGITQRHISTISNLK